MTDSKATRKPVVYRYDVLNPMFIKWMARLAAYATETYPGGYASERLTGGQSPANHIQEHLRAYVMGEDYDHFDGDPRWHLVAVAYNAMMEFFYRTKWGHVRHPLDLSKETKK